MASGLEKAYTKFLADHGDEFSYLREDGVKFCSIAPNPVVAGERGLGCVICAAAARHGVIAESVFSKYQYMGYKISALTEAPKLELEVLKRHCNLSASQASGKKPHHKRHAKAVHWMGVRSCRHGAQAKRVTEQSASATYTAPTKGQIRIAIELVNGWGGRCLEDYTRRCATAREEGAPIPHTRCSAEVARQIVMAAAETEFDFDRTAVIPRALEIAWAQDKADDILLMKYRSVSTAWEVACRVIDAVPPRGDRATQCAEDMERSLRNLCTAHGGQLDTAAYEKFKALCRNANADGEPAEQLAFRLAKGTAALPNLDFIARAEEHSAALVLQRAVKKCECLEVLLGKLAHNFTRSAANGRAKCPGGFARFVNDSLKLRRKYAAHSIAQTSSEAKAICSRVGVAPPAPNALRSVLALRERSRMARLFSLCMRFRFARTFSLCENAVAFRNRF